MKPQKLIRFVVRFAVWPAVFFFGLLSIGILYLGAIGIYYAQCVYPGEEVQRVVLPFVQGTARAEFQKFGATRSIERISAGDAPIWKKYRVFARQPSGREEYRRYIRHVSDGEDVVIQPRRGLLDLVTGRCFCRPTFILYDHARQVWIVGRSQ